MKGKGMSMRYSDPKMPVPYNSPKVLLIGDNQPSQPNGLQGRSVDTMTDIICRI